MKIWKIEKLREKNVVNLEKNSPIRMTLSMPTVEKSLISTGRLLCIWLGYDGS